MLDTPGYIGYHRLMEIPEVPGFEPRELTLSDSRTVVLRSFKPADTQQCLKLREEVYAEPFTEAEWAWKFGPGCPFPNQVLVVEAGGRVVGIQGMLAFPFRLGDSYVSSLMLLDLMIHPDWHRQGIFTKIIRIIESEVLARFDFIYTFPNRNSHPGFVDKLGWLVPFRPRLLARPALPRGLAKEAIPQHRSRAYTGLVKNSTYLEWRYSRPGRTYEIPSPKSVLAYQKHFGLEIGFAAEFGEDDPYALKIMEREASPRPLFFLTNPSTSIFPMLKRKGFTDRVNHLRRFHVVIKPNPGFKRVAHKLADWELSFGDCDVI